MIEMHGKTETGTEDASIRVNLVGDDIRDFYGGDDVAISELDGTYDWGIITKATEGEKADSSHFLYGFTRSDFLAKLKGKMERDPDLELELYVANVSDGGKVIQSVHSAVKGLEVLV